MALLAGCGSSGGATTSGETVVDPLTETVPPSRINAALTPEAGIFRLVGAPSFALRLVRVAAARGFVGSEGLSLRIRDVSSAKAVATALETGTADAAVVSSAEALELVAQGIPLRIVLLMTSSASELSILSTEAVSDIAGLTGLRVAVTPGSEADLLLRGALAESGMEPGSVTIVPTVGIDPGAMLTRGEVDAAVVSHQQSTAALLRDPTLRTLYAAGDHPGFISRVLVVRDSILYSKPGQILAMVRSWRDVYGFARDQRDVLIADLAAHGKQDPVATTSDFDGLTLYDIEANAVDLLPGGEYYDATIIEIETALVEAGRVNGLDNLKALVDGAFAQAVASAR